MTQQSSETPVETTRDGPAPTPGSQGLTLLASRFRDPQRWRATLYDLALWFMGAFVVITALKQYCPGYPIVVATPSIQEGLYWVDTRDHDFHPGDYVSFAFRPTQSWLQGRYGSHPVHTKLVLGVAGDTVYADASRNLVLCRPGQSPAVAGQCVTAGHVYDRDSMGRPLYSWVPAGQSYTLRQDELWVFGTHPRSLDSRYHGPVRIEDMYGKATPLIQLAGG
jgi:type IV secretory pathway protease TraF